MSHSLREHMDTRLDRFPARLGAPQRIDAWGRLLAAMGTLIQGDVSALVDLPDDEWAAFVAECDLHWTSPLAYRVLAANRHRVAVPREAWRGLRTSYLLSKARTRRADALLIPVLAALEAAGIPVIALKGLHLSTQVYGGPAARPMIDADLLLRRGDLRAAAQIVESFGYRQRADSRRGSDPDSPREDHQHLATFWYPNGPPIELHHDLMPPGGQFRIDPDELWSRARPARIGEAGIRVLAPEDALLHLCVHAAIGHGFAMKLLSLCDVPVALRHWHDDFDWQAFWSRARRTGAERSALITLSLVGHRLGCPLPDRASLPAVTAEMDSFMTAAEQRMRRKASALARRAKSPTAVEAGGASPLAVRFALGRLPTARSRWRFVARRIFIPRRELAPWFGLATAPSWVSVLHPVRIVAVAARQAFGQARLAVRRGSGRGIEAEARLLDWLNGG